MSFNQQLVIVQGLVNEQIAPRLDNALAITRAMDTSQESYVKAQQYGTQGAVYLVEKPIRSNVERTLAFDAVNSGSWQQQYMSVAVTNEVRNNYQVPNITEATFTPESIHGGQLRSRVRQIAEEIELDSANTAAFGGYRFFGDPLVPAGQFSTVDSINLMIAQFRTFGGTDYATCFLPQITSARIKTQSYQLFTPEQNDEFVKQGSIGVLGGNPFIRFMQTSIIPTHFSGTASTETLNTTGYTIVSVTPTPPNVPSSSGTPNGTTEIVLSGMTPGTTIIENDMIQINSGDPSSPLRFLNYVNYGIPSAQPVQGRVITGGTVDGAGALTITISPALIFDAAVTDPDVNRNLNRDIVPGSDTLQVAKSHKAGYIFFKEYIKYVSPKLPPLTPFPSQSVTTDHGISVRSYYGAVFGGATDQFVIDNYYGYGVADEGVCRILIPVDES